MKKAFTLTELLLVTGIILIFTSLTFVYYREGEKNFAVIRSAFKLSQDIRRAQEMAMATKECCGNIVPPGYGIYLKEGQNCYILYADTNPQKGNENFDGGDTIIEKICFEKEVSIKEITPASCSINFSPPTPKVKIKGEGGSEFSEVTIVLSLDGKEKKLKVNKLGVVSME